MSPKKLVAVNTSIVDQLVTNPTNNGYKLFKCSIGTLSLDNNSNTGDIIQKGEEIEIQLVDSYLIDMEKEWDHAIFEVIKRLDLNLNQPRYLILSLPSTKDTLVKYQLINFIPDTSKVQDKMIYSSYSNFLINELGGRSRFGKNGHCTNLDELLEVIKEFNVNNQEENENLEINDEQKPIISTPTLSLNSVLGLPYQFSPTASIPIINYLAFNSDLLLLTLEDKTQLLHIEEGPKLEGLDQAQYLFPTTSPSIGLYRLTLQAKKFTALIYCCPINSNIQSKMIYASGLATTIQLLKSVKINIDTKIEVDDPYSLTNDLILEKLVTIPSPTNQNFLDLNENLDTSPKGPKGQRPRTRKR